MTIEYVKRGRRYSSGWYAVIKGDGDGMQQLHEIGKRLHAPARRNDFMAMLDATETEARASLAAAGDGVHEDDSPADYAGRILRACRLIRAAIKRGETEDAMLEAVHLGILLGEAAMWEAIDATGGAGGRPVGSTQKRDAEMAAEFRRLRESRRSDRSDTALMAEIGAKQEPPLRRSASIAAIKRGLAFLSGKRG